MDEPVGLPPPLALPPLLALPAELVHGVLTHLPPLSLVDVALTCRRLHLHAYDDELWRPFVNANLPGNALGTPWPAPSFRALYGTHHPYWFLTRHTLWFADALPLGKLLVARFSPARNAVEAYALVAERGAHTFEFWDADADVIIHTFAPTVQLDLNQPVLKLDAAAVPQGPGPRLQRELLMDMHAGGRAAASASLYSMFQLARPLPAGAVGPGTRVWPPLVVPAASRTRNESVQQYRGAGHRPAALADVSADAFRLRKWMEFVSRGEGVSVRVGEAVTTYATLPRHCYTPTREKPWRGVWCGDYSGHGCEFLVVLQPDEPAPLPERAARALRERRGSGSSEDSWESVHASVAGDDDGAEGHAGYGTDSAETSDLEPATLGEDGAEREGGAGASADEGAPGADVDDDDDDDGAVYSGRIEAVKLTGDPNVPRGEYTFIAPDIGRQGLVRVAHESIFKGARIVRSVGHVAYSGFREGQ